MLRRFLTWLRARIAALQLAHNDSARNVLMRLLFALLAFKFIGDIWDAGSLTLWAPNSHSAAIASFVGVDYVGWAFVVLSLGLVPFMLAELCWWVRRRKRAYAKLAMLTLGLAGALYLLLVVLARNADLVVIKQTYARTGVECLVMMLLIGTLLNAQLRTDHGLDDFVDESNRVPLEPSAG